MLLHVSNLLVLVQVDADYKLQDMKKLHRELEMKGKGYKKRLDDLHAALSKHLEQYVLPREWILVVRARSV